MKGMDILDNTTKQSAEAHPAFDYKEIMQGDSGLNKGGCSGPLLPEKPPSVGVENKPYYPNEVVPATAGKEELRKRKIDGDKQNEGNPENRVEQDNEGSKIAKQPIKNEKITDSLSSAAAQAPQTHLEFSSPYAK